MSQSKGRLAGSNYRGQSAGHDYIGRSSELGSSCLFPTTEMVNWCAITQTTPGCTGLLCFPGQCKEQNKVQGYLQQAKAELRRRHSGSHNRFIVPVKLGKHNQSDPMEGRDFCQM